MSVFGAIGLRLLGIGKWLADAGKALLRWIFADWRNGPLLLFAIAFFVCVFVRIPNLERELATTEDSLRAERQAKDDLVEDYRQAAIIAIARAQQNVARVEAEQTAITKEIVDDYETRIAAVRARAGTLASALAGELRRSKAFTYSSDAAAAGVPGPGAPAGRAADAAGDRGLPAPRTDPSAASAMNLQERLIATEQAIQLDALIDWVIAQSEVQTSEDSPQ